MEQNVKDARMDKRFILVVSLSDHTSDKDYWM